MNYGPAESRWFRAAQGYPIEMEKLFAQRNLQFLPTAKFYPIRGLFRCTRFEVVEKGNLDPAGGF
jgi:hypothetical protein